MYNCRRVQTPLRMGRRSNEKKTLGMGGVALSVSLSLSARRLLTLPKHFI